MAGAESVHVDAHGLRHADGVGQLDFSSVGKARGHDVLCDVTAHIGGAAIHFAGILAAEGATAVAGRAAVGVHNDFPARQAAVAHRTANDKAASGIDEELGVGVNQFFRQSVADDQLFDFCVNGDVADSLIMLGGDHHGFDALHFIAVVFHGDLALAVRAQPGQGFFLADLRQAPRKAMGILQGRGHQFRRFAGGVAEHQSLVPGATGVHTQGDIGALSVERYHHCTGSGVESLVAMVVADISHDIAHELGHRDIGLGGHLPCHHHQPCGQKGFAGHAAIGVILERGVQNRIRYLVCHLVGMPFCNAFRCEKMLACRGHAPTPYPGCGSWPRSPSA